MVSYKDKEKMQYDKSQTVLDKDGCSENPHKYAEKIILAEFWKIYLCPFCLESNELWKWNKIKGFYVCCVCGNSMTLNSIAQDMTTEEFAKWVFDYRLLGFWRKIFPDFETWNKKLYNLGLSYDFWNEYNRLKNEWKITHSIENEDDWH